VPTDGTRAANVGTGDFGTSPIFVQLSDKPLLVSTLLVGVSERKAQWQIEKLCADPIRVARTLCVALDVLCVRREFLGMDRQQ